MHGVIVEFQFEDDFDPVRLSGIARDQKAFTVDEANRRATNVYLWESEEAARAFFDDALVDRVTSLYGVRPTVTFVEVAELVDNTG
jgi:hypothetical protein